MTERWRSDDVQRLLINKHVVIIGDSIQRGFYKDLVRLLQCDQYVDRSVLRSKGTKTCQGDELIEGGHFGPMHNGKNYREVRRYQTGHHVVSYYMVTACYSEYIETILEDFMIWKCKPDIVTMASCVWDITRYGPRSRSNYQTNLQILAKRLKLALGEDTLFIWNTATPVSREVRGGFMLEEIHFRNETLRYDIVEANFYAAQVMRDHRYDVMDLHYHFRHLIHFREQDGIHWNSVGHRKMSNLILDHIAQVLKFPLPRNMWDNNSMNNRVPRAPDRCHICNKTFQSSVALGQHQAASHQMIRRLTVGDPCSLLTGPSVFNTKEQWCSSCSVVFQSHTALMQHIAMKHVSVVSVRKEEDKFYPCPVCRAIMFERNDFVLHIKTLHPDMLNVETGSQDKDGNSRDGCPTEEEVDVDDSSSRGSSSHSSSQLNDEIPRCNICRRVFFTREACSQHKRDEHTDGTNSNVQGNPTSRDTNEATRRLPTKSSAMFVCSVCSKNFTSWELLTQHELLTRHNYHHSLLPGEGSEQAVCYTCDHCDVAFTTQQELFKHRTSIKTGHKCSICSHFFLTRQIIEQHKKDAHPERRPRPDGGSKFICECGMSFYRQLSLDGHKNLKCGCGVHVCIKKAPKHALRCSEFAQKFPRYVSIPEKRRATDSRTDSVDKRQRTH